MLGRRRVNQFRQSVARTRPLPPEANPWYWHPARFGVKFADESFRTRLKEEMGNELEVTWNPINQRWQVWTVAPTVQHKICSGWKLLFIHNGPNAEYLPLDARLYARLYASSVMAYGSAKKYFDRIASEMERDKLRKDRQHTQDTIDLAMPSFEHSQIKVGYGSRNNGSKFATYHA